jgi:hypothetical protein
MTHSRSATRLKAPRQTPDPVPEDEGSDVESDDPITEDPSGTDPITERGAGPELIPEDRGSADDHSNDDPVTRERVAEDTGGRGSD